MRRLVQAAFLFGAICSGAFPTAAQEQDKYPSRPIKMIVPFPAGGPIDVMARLVAQKLSTTVGQIIVDNRPGGGGTIGLKAGANADPDGYTLLFSGPMALSVLPSLLEPGTVKPFVPIAIVSSVPFVLIVAPRVPAKTVPELITYAKANPGKLNFGAPTGAVPQLVGELFKLKAGIDFVTIPYKGAAGTITDLIGGEIDMAFEPTSVVLAHISEGSIRPLAVTGATRSPELPALPTMVEAGVGGLIAVSWTGMVGPAGTPPAIVARLNAAINDALKSQDVIVALKKLGADSIGGSPQDFGALLADETPKWLEVIRISGIKID